MAHELQPPQPDFLLYYIKGTQLPALTLDVNWMLHNSWAKKLGSLWKAMANNI